MILSLFLKECKQVSKSIIYFVFLGVIVLFYVSQLEDYAGSDISAYSQSGKYDYYNPLLLPPKNAESYGTKSAEIPEQVMPNMLNNLVNEYSANDYTTYPIGFYKKIKLNETQQAEIENIIVSITGKSVSQLMDLIGEYEAQTLKPTGQVFYMNNLSYENVIPIVTDYEIFKQKMAAVDKILGGGSSYSENELKSYGSIPITYEERLQEYQEFIAYDKITGAYARLFCDYMGIVIALFSIFVPVSYLLQDRRANFTELVYSHKTGSAKLICTRYAASVVMILLPFLLLSLFPLSQLTIFGITNGMSVDTFAFVKYIIGWLLPTLMAITAVGFVLTLLSDTPVAIAVQFLWSFTSLMNGNISGGDYGLTLIIRHNSLQGLRLMADNMNQLILNRIIYVLLALALLTISIGITELKRRGRLDVGGYMQKIYRNFTSRIKTNIAG